VKTRDEGVHSLAKWRVGHVGRDGMYYEELRDGKWERLEIDGEMLTGRAHHVIYFGSRQNWQRHPEWARGRRDEIIDRIKTAFRIPDYEYDGESILAEPDRRLLIEAAGGLSDEPCRWKNCTERALRGKAICVFHAFGPHMWRKSNVQQHNATDSQKPGAADF
jgi:hypothetical protein